MSNLPKYAIIVAGGSGSRMNSAVPKQFLPLAGKPVLMHTLQQFSKAEPAAAIFLALPAEQITVWRQLCQDYSFELPHTVVTGGQTRFGSVQNALQTLPDGDGLVAIHDGVRPLVSEEIIRKSFTGAEEFGSAVAVVPVKDSVRKVKKNNSKNIDRSSLRLVQTPQTFRLGLLQTAFQQASHDEFTDDASVLEAAGHKIHLITGSYRNIKITTPEDMVIAEALLQKIEG